VLGNYAREWVELDPCAETRCAVEAMLAGQDHAALEKAFGQRVEFGTAGLRAEMGPGVSRLNDLVIIQTAQGLCKYLELTLGEDKVKERGIVLGYDHRKRGSLNSHRFALLTAHVFISRGVKAFLFGKYVPTPFVPFAVRTLGAAAGVMVTASHNPKNDNGFKVYWGNACQIIPPHDHGIAKSIQENLKPWEKSYDGVTQDVIAKNPLCEDLVEKIADEYYKTISEKLCKFGPENSKEECAVKIAYTAMHGIGCPWAKRSFETFGLKPFSPVPEQVEPDAEFTTVAFPNPEEGKGALRLAMETAEREACTLILANDPDADRLAVAEKQGDSWKIFTGNEIGALLGHWEWVNYKQRTSSGNKKQKSSKGAAMVASTVSSKMLRAISQVEGFRFEETLTGFKWIGNKSLELQEEGYDVLFSFEEAIGFCVGDNVVDKDGISAVAVFAEMAGQLKKNGKTCAEHLVELQEKYGYFITNNHYIVSPDTAQNVKVFNKLRNGGKYISSCGPEGKYRIKYVRDLMSPGFDSSKPPSNKPTLPVSDSSQMITFTFENGCVATLRMSGTEPKLKYYTEMSGPDIETVTKQLHDLVEEGIKPLIT